MPKEKPEKKECVHHWIIETPDSRTSTGVCKLCGEVKEFSNDWLNPYLTTQRPGESQDSQPGVLDGIDEETLFPEEVTR